MQAIFALVTTLTIMAWLVESIDNRLALTPPSWNPLERMGKDNVVELVKKCSSSISSLPPVSCPTEEAYDGYGGARASPLTCTGVSARDYART